MKKYNITVNGKTYEVEVEEVQGSENKPVQASTKTEKKTETKTKSKPEPKKEVKKEVQKVEISEGATTIEAPMPGAVLDFKVNVGDNVQAGDVVLILEAMKMENEITAPASGKVSAIHVSKGENVGSGDTLVSLN